MSPCFPAGSPGAMAEYFRGHNPDGTTVKGLCGPLQPLGPSFRYRKPRMQVVDEQGVDFCIMLPTQVLGLEEMLWEDPGAMVASMRALNRWTHEEWSWNIDGRVVVTGAISLIDPVAAEQELEMLIAQGCTVIGMRPRPVKVPGHNYSIGDPMYDPFWARCAEAGVIVGIHAADTSYSMQQAMFGETGKVGWRQTPLAEIMAVHTERPIFDTMAAMISHGVFDRHPKLKVAELVRHLPIENVIYGSDWPHPEGLSNPEYYVYDLQSFTPTEQKLIMGDNLCRSAGLPV